ncbi:hypothetical protein KI688_009971 [Linnemannia hyalina]|uniref:Uncharacterized protein n=1 Tax=Linnemannia hyalina TaxID=64524 RepID=A0A9P7XYN4_9FUNG|nr:hypothetical protein KI688_009971 [Linnemannia hyalina]
MTDSDTIHTIPVLNEEGSRQSRRPTRLPPSRIYTINTSHQESTTTTTGPKTAPIGLSSSPFRHSNHSTGNINTTTSKPHSDIISRGRSFSTSSNNRDNSNNVSGIVGGRSRSFSTSSGGVVPLSRADSEASRLALEALIQKRLDRITQRLDEFNFQSHELYARTETLAKSFHDNAKRLYKVEDHLLRVQGKPGLSDAYLENGGSTRRRRLTNDLEELRMGVKTLRKKFQAAGSVVSTVEWWKRLKDVGQDGTEGDGDSNPARTENDQLLNDLAVSSRPSSSPLSASTSPVVVPEKSRSPSLSSSSSSFSRTLSRKEGQALQKIMTAPDAMATVYVASSTSTQDTIPSLDPSLPHGASTPAQGLRSPPLTPKSPPTLLGSFIQRGHLDNLLHTPTNIKARPLSVIHDLEEPPLQLPISPRNTAWTRESKDTTIAAPTLTDDTIHLDNQDDYAIPLASSSSVQGSPPPLQSNNHNRNDSDNESRPVFLEIFTPPSPAASVSSAFAFAFAGSETAETVSRSTEPMPLVEIPGVENAGCGEGLQGNNKPAEQVSKDDGADEEEMTGLDTTSSKLSPATVAAPVQEHDSVSSTPVSGTSLASDNKDGLAFATSLQPEVSKDAPAKEASLIAETDAEDTWVQFLWKVLIRLEYFLLGTAVLGAMMPESLPALCAGFLSAILYGALVVRHRILAGPESEAPRPPVGTKGFAGGVGVGKRRYRVRE